MIPKISVQWAASIASVFWGVWWSTLIKDISVSKINSMNVLGYAVDKKYILVVLVAWGVLFAILFVRWLYKVQYMDLGTGIGHWINNSRGLTLTICIFILIITSIPSTFMVDSNMVVYGAAISLLWPLAPFIVAIWPDDYT